jgi:predicted  nucleic acid-binding Zn-ribbon protein
VGAAAGATAKAAPSFSFGGSPAAPSPAPASASTPVAATVDPAALAEAIQKQIGPLEARLKEVIVAEGRSSREATAAALAPLNVQQQSSLLTICATELYDKIAHVEQLAAKLAAAHEKLTEALNARAIDTATLHEALDGAAQRKAEAEAKMAKMDEERAAQEAQLKAAKDEAAEHRQRAEAAESKQKEHADTVEAQLQAAKDEAKRLKAELDVKQTFVLRLERDLVFARQTPRVVPGGAVDAEPTATPSSAPRTHTSSSFSGATTSGAGAAARATTLGWGSAVQAAAAGPIGGVPASPAVVDVLDRLERLPAGGAGGASPFSSTPGSLVTAATPRRINYSLRGGPA